MGPIIIGIIVLVIAVLIVMGVKVTAEYERGVIFRLSRLSGTKGPGLFFIIPFVEKMIKVDLRVVEMDISSQKVVTLDNVSVQVDAKVFFRVVDPESAVVKVLDWVRATSQVSQSSFNNFLQQTTYKYLEHEHLTNVGEKLRSIIDETTSQWGVHVSEVKLNRVLSSGDYVCNVCGKEITVKKVGSGTLICCNEEMKTIG